jgi:hypothetical protein
MKEISSMDFPQHGEVFYFNGQALQYLLLAGYVNIFGKQCYQNVLVQFHYQIESYIL